MEILQGILQKYVSYWIKILGDFMDNTKKIMNGLEKYSKDKNVESFLKKIFALEYNGLHQYKTEYMKVIEEFAMSGESNED